MDMQYCPNHDCPDYGKVGAGNIGVHSQKEQRCICRTCKKTFAATYGTPLYRRHLDHQLIGWMVSLLTHGCPKSAIVATFEVDPRTVDELWASSGQHGQRVHEATVQQGRLDLLHVQMDEIRHKIQRAVIWVKPLLTGLIEKVKAAALCRPLLLCFDGLKTYISACHQVFRSPLPTGKPGRPRLVPWPTFTWGRSSNSMPSGGW